MHDDSSNPKTKSPSRNFSLSLSVMSLDRIEVEFSNAIFLEPVDYANNIIVKNCDKETYH